MAGSFVEKSNAVDDGNWRFARSGKFNGTGSFFRSTEFFRSFWQGAG